MKWRKKHEGLTLRDKAEHIKRSEQLFFVKITLLAKQGLQVC